MSIGKVISQKPLQPSVSWKLGTKKGKRGIEVEWAYNLFHKTTSSGRISGCIPSLGLFLSARDHTELSRKGAALAEAFMDHFFVEPGPNSIKKLIVELSKLGYTSNENPTFLIHRLSKNDYRPGKFKAVSTQIPDYYKDAEQSSHKAKREMAF